jgi:alpha-L-fucosidase
MTTTIKTSAYTKRSFVLFFISIWILSISFLSADTGSGLAPENKPDTTWFSDAGYGIFLHWGAYSQTGGRWKGLERNRDLWGEWIKNRASISTADYEIMARSFDPTDFNPEEWASVFKEAGAKYVVLTAKHHEGFAMFHTATTKFNSFDWPDHYHGDPVKSLGDAVRADGLKFGVYYSQQIDWHNQRWKAQFEEYFNNICAPQVTELTTKYGPMSVIWFDIGMPNHDEAEQLKQIVRKNQPEALISPRIGGGVTGDYTGGGDNEVPASVRPSPWESCMTLTQHWSSYPQDISQKSSLEVIRLLADIRSKGGNMLLDVGPDHKGRLIPRDVTVLRQVGLWLKRNGEAIYGVHASPLPGVPWGRVTSKGDMLYLHLFDMPPQGEILVPGIRGEIAEAWMLEDQKKTPLPVTPDGAEDYRVGLDVNHTPAEAFDPYDTVVALKLKPEATFDTEYLIDGDLANEFHPALADLTGGAVYGHRHVIYSQLDEPGVERARYDETAQLVKPESAMEWTFRSTHDGDFHLILSYAWKEAIPGTLKISVDNEVFTANVQPRDGTVEHPYTEIRAGTVAIRKAGEHVIRVQCNIPSASKKDGGVIIHQLTLVPSRTTPLETSTDGDGKPLSAASQVPVSSTGTKK